MERYQSLEKRAANGPGILRNDENDSDKKGPKLRMTNKTNRPSRANGKIGNLSKAALVSPCFGCILVVDSAGTQDLH